jgi:choline-sulfatase
VITRRTALQTLAGAPAILRGASRPAGDKPNLLFLWTDQQRADTLAAYGNRTFKMPVLNRLASQSIVFDRAYVTQPVCTPSRSSVMTGWWPHQTGCRRNNIALPASTPTVPELLNDAGYRTGYMGKWHLGDEIFPQHGFQEWRGIEDGIYSSYYSAGRDPNARSAYHHFLEDMGYEPGKGNFFSRGFAAGLPFEHSKPAFLANEATRFLSANANQPWMLYVNFLEPHTPFHSAFDDLHSAEQAPLPPNYPGIPEKGEPRWYVERRAGYMKRFEGIDLKTREGFQRIARNYAGLCSLVDQAVGRILWALEASGQMENTIIVFTSDHGEMMGAHSLVTKQVMYEESIRIPLFMRIPFRHQMPQRISQPVSHIDTVPTVLDLLGKKAPENLPGRSNVPLFGGGRRENADVHIEWTEDASDSPGSDARTILSDEWKMVLHARDTHLLFHRTRDPQEMHNLYYEKESQPVVRRMHAKIAAWQQRTKDTMKLPEPQ